MARIAAGNFKTPHMKIHHTSRCWGAGLGAGTLRARVRTLRKFLDWLAASCERAFPSFLAWRTLRFAGHRGILPKDVNSVLNGSLLAKLTRSKTIGADLDLTFRLVMVDSASFVQKPKWFAVG